MIQVSRFCSISYTMFNEAGNYFPVGSSRARLWPHSKHLMSLIIPRSIVTFFLRMSIRIRHFTGRMNEDF